MTITIKKWSEFQHYKPETRNITWIKLHKKLLDDPEWASLDPQAAKVLVMLWLLASERNGQLPDTPEIAFRLRLPKTSIESALSKLSHWLEQDASNLLANGYQPASLELEKEKEKEKEQECPNTRVDFEYFYQAYPKKQKKEKAWESWQKIMGNGAVPLHQILGAVERWKQVPQWTKEKGQFIPMPATWLNNRGWEDEIEELTIPTEEGGLG